MPYRGALLRCITAQCHCIATQSCPPQPRYKSLYRDPAPSRAHCAPYRRLPGRIVAEQWPYRSPWLPCITTHGRPLSATIQFCIMTQLPTARHLRAHAARPTRAGRTIDRSWPYRRVVLQAGSAVSWPLLHAQPSLPNPVSRYNPLYRDSDGQ